MYNAITSKYMAISATYNDIKALYIGFSAKHNAITLPYTIYTKMTNTDRKWMYEQYDDRGHLSPIFINGVKAFAEFASSKPSHMDEGRIKCPCKNCRNRPFLDVDVVRLHLYKDGFVQNYKCWDRHGETLLDNTLSDADDTYTTLHEQHAPTYREMILDATYSDCVNGFMSRPIEEEPNTTDKKFFDMLKAADKELWSSCKKATQLSVVSRLLNIKSDYRMPEQCYDTICQLINDVIPEENNMVDSLYNIKKLVQSLVLPVEVQTEIKKCVDTFSYTLEKNAFFPLDSEVEEAKIPHTSTVCSTAPPLLLGCSSIVLHFMRVVTATPTRPDFDCSGSDVTSALDSSSATPTRTTRFHCRRTCPEKMSADNHVVAPGKNVEVITVNHLHVTSYNPATCLQIRGETCRVMHQSKKDDDGFALIEGVPLGMVRPEPPRHPLSRGTIYFVGDIVDYKHDGGWWKCKVTKKDGNGTLTVTFEHPTSGEHYERMVARGSLRLHHEWSPHIPGEWILSSVFVPIDSADSSEGSS
ncbi:hypothetical protein LXL04_001707 [Taraxacum kok-saghyz]